MAFSSHRTRFQGDLAGIKQEEISELDFDRNELSERLEYVENKYSKVEKYHEEYTSDYYKVDVNIGDNLSSDINIFKAIEKDANYLLNSVDISRNTQYKYNLLSQEEFDDKIKKENKSDLYCESTMDILKPAFKNEYKNMDLTIENADLKENTEMGRILREYEATRVHLRCEMNNIKEGNGSYLKLYQIKNILGSTKGDMLDVKRSYKGITRPANDCGGQKELDLFAIDYTNPAHIKACINFCKLDGEIQPDNAMSHIGSDIKVAIDFLSEINKLDQKDLDIIEGINAGVSMRKLEVELSMSNQAISKRFNKIAEKISNHYTYINLELDI